jgi:hypothetical protein
MGWRGFEFVHHHSRTLFCRAVPNLSITIRNFLIAVGEQTPVLRVGLRALDVAVEWLARQEEVHAVGLVARYGKRNEQAQWIVQSGDVDSRGVWAHGLRGQGQLVSVLKKPFTSYVPLIKGTLPY